MAGGKEYDEVDAVVRIPKGERLADSHKTEGWSRGFTPKSSGKGPQHVELRLKDEGEAPATREPEVIYVTEYVEGSRASELTPAQQEIADALSEALVALFKAATPYVAEWWETKALPAMVAKHDDVVQKRRARRAEREAPRSTVSATSFVVEEPVEHDSSSQQVAAVNESAITMTPEQFQYAFMSWLAREDAQQALWNAITRADMKDGDGALLEWRQRLKELTPEQRTERVNAFLSENRSILATLGRQFLNAGHPSNSASRSAADGTRPKPPPQCDLARARESRSALWPVGDARGVGWW